LAKAILKQYRDLINEITERDRLGLDWTYKMRTFALPRSDKSILEKKGYALSKVTVVFGSLVLEQLQILQMYPQLIPSEDQAAG